MPPRVNPEPLFDGAVKAGSQDDKAGDCDYRERFLFSISRGAASSGLTQTAEPVWPRC